MSEKFEENLFNPDSDVSLQETELMEEIKKQTELAESEDLDEQIHAQAALERAQQKLDQLRSKKAA